MSNYRKTLIVDLFPFGDIRNGLRLLSKHRGGLAMIDDDKQVTKSELDRNKLNENPNLKAAYKLAKLGLKVTGPVKPGMDAEDQRILFAVNWFKGDPAKTTSPALKQQLADLTAQDRLIILMHGSKPGEAAQFNRPNDLKGIAEWLVACGFRRAKKISLAVCYAGMAHPKEGIEANSAVAFANALLAAAADTDLEVDEVVARKGKVMIREDGTKYVEDDTATNWLGFKTTNIYPKGKGKASARR